ncbi:MAG TPA: peptidase M1, partial [Blastococcus sp.]|nr:peptidase M1 [Blastococcus sp.]
MRARRAAAATAAAFLLTGCTSFADTVAAPESPPSASAAAPEPDEGTCPAERAEPDPDRPEISL